MIELGWGIKSSQSWFELRVKKIQTNPIVDFFEIRFISLNFERMKQSRSLFLIA